MDTLEQQGAALRALAQEIADEIARGAHARIAEIDIRRPQIMQLLGALNQTVMRCGHVPGGERSGAFFAAVNHYRPQAGFWVQVDRMLRQQLPPRPRPFEGGRSEEATLNSSQQSAADQLLDVLHFALKADEQSAQAQTFGCHDDIPLQSSRFFGAAHAAYRVLLAQGQAAGAAFLDIGCGNGMKLLSAAPYFERCDGLEYQDTSVTVAERLLDAANASGCQVFQGDALTFDGYGEYQVIYLYKPMRDPDVLIELEDRLLAQVAPGTLVIAPYYAFQNRHAEAGCGRITRDLYLAGSDQATADALREAAEFTGLGLRQGTSPAPSLWDPIIQASAERGFALPSSGSDFVA